MKAKRVNQIREYTDNIEVLKSILKSENIPETVESVCSLYKNLRKPHYKIRQSYADTIVLAYIEDIIKKDYKVGNLLSPEFLKKVRFVKEEDLKQLLDYVIKNKCRFITENTRSLEKYSILELIELTEIHNRIPNDEYTTITNLIFSMAVQSGISPTIVNKIIKEFQEAQDHYKERLRTYLTLAGTYDAEGKDVLTIAHLLRTVKNTEEANIIFDIANEKHWLGVATFGDVYLELIGYAFENKLNPIILYDSSCRNIFHKRKLSEIKEMLSLNIAYPSLTDVLSSEMLIEELTWIQQRNLCIDYNLHEDRMMAKFKEVYTSLSQYEIRDQGLYKALTDKLDKAIYEETVEDYLERCSTIEEFASVINKNFKKDEDVQNYNMLTLDTKIFQ